MKCLFLLNNQKYFRLTNFSKGTVLTLILIFTSLLSQQASAQYYRSDFGGTVGGIYGGIVTAQIHGDGFRGYDKFGYTGGGMLIRPISDAALPYNGTLAVSIGVQFTQKGAKGAQPNLGVLGQVIDLNYAEVPMMMHYYRGPRKSNLGVGFTLGYVAWEETQIDRGMGYQLVENHYNKFELSFTVNPQIHLYKGFFLSPRFQYSFLNIKNKKAPAVGRAEQFNDLLAVSILYLFGGNSRY